MTALPLDIQPLPEGWTVADVDALPENGVRYELVDGVPYAMSPPKIKHQVAQRRLANAIEAAAPAGFHVVDAVGVIMAEDQRRIPDVMVLRTAGFDSEASNVLAEHALMVAQIVSPSSRSDDRFRKPAQYAEAGILVYLRVELAPMGIFAYELVDGVYKEVGHAEAGQTLELATPFPFTIDPAVLIR